MALRVEEPRKACAGDESLQKSPAFFYFQPKSFTMLQR